MRKFHIENNKKGNALVLMAIAVPALLAACGLALDWGRGVWTKSQLQKAADAGALCGVSYLDNHLLAADQAAGMVAANFADPDGESYGPVGADQYEVQLKEAVPTFFMLLFGHSTMDVAVSARAEASKPVPGLSGGAFPFAIINPALNSDPCDDLTPANWGRRYIIFYGEDNIQVPDWANGCDPIPGVPEGNSRGWRGALRLNQDGTYGDPLDTGTDDLVWCMLNGWPGTMRINDHVPTKTGNIDQPVARARDTLLGPNPISWEEFDKDRDRNCSRVVMVPIIHLVHETRGDEYTTRDWDSGAAWLHDEVVVDGFAPFFILSVKEQGDVDGNGKMDDRDWIVGRYIPGTMTTNFLPPAPNTPDYGLLTLPRLVD